jgi:hypothetical protein
MPGQLSSKVALCCQSLMILLDLHLCAYYLLCMHSADCQALVVIAPRSSSRCFRRRSVAKTFDATPSKLSALKFEWLRLLRSCVQYHPVHNVSHGTHTHTAGGSAIMRAYKGLILLLGCIFTSSLTASGQGGIAVLLYCRTCFDYVRTASNLLAPTGHHLVVPASYQPAWYSHTILLLPTVA